MNSKNPFYKYLSVEDKEHIRVVDFLKTRYPNIISFHIPNEGKKTAFERYKYSLMGALKGCPDFAIMFPKYKSVTFEGKQYKELDSLALFIELKAPEHNRIVMKGKNSGKVVKSKGKASDEQLNIIRKLNKLRYSSHVCYGADDAIRVITDYLSTM